MGITRLEVGQRMSEAVCVHGLAYLSGQVPEDLTKDIVGQTHDVLGQIDKILEKLGTDKTKIVQAQIFLKDMNDFAGMNQAWDAWVPVGRTPARATIEANLAKKEWKVEILVTAAF